jgi:hypothetical protein
VVTTTTTLNTRFPCEASRVIDAPFVDPEYPRGYHNDRSVESPATVG